MAGTRLIGQDCSVTIIQDNQPLTTIDTIKSIEVTVLLDIIKEGFLGQTTDRRDEVYHGVSGKIEAQLSGTDLLLLVESIRRRAKNRRSGTRITTKSTFIFPDGDRAIYVIPDLKFGNIPLGVRGRTEFVEMSLDFEADDMTFVTR
jgi:hypothetical protein